MISSVKNEFIKSLKKQIKDKELICLDNPKIIYEANDCGVEFLYILKRKDYNLKHAYSCEIVELTDNVFDALSTTEKSQGVLAITRLNTHSLKPPQGNFLVMDTIQDPGNVGTLIRSALGANFIDIYMIDCAKVNSDKVIRSSMGAIFKTRCYEISKENFIDNFKSWNKSMYTCDMNGNDIYKTKFALNSGIVVGNEGQGVSDEIARLCTSTIAIPMKNQLESLNAGVSGSIIMYQMANSQN